LSGLHGSARYRILVLAASAAFLFSSSIILTSGLWAQETTPDSTPPESSAKAETSEASEASEAEKTESAAPAAKSGEALRNENVFASKLDNDTQKADNSRLGINYVIVAQPQAESNYYAAQNGNSPSDSVVLARPPKFLPWHFELFETLQNSAMNARTFFQVGPVAPSRSNNYGFRFGGKAGPLGYLTGAWTQGKSRGMVNGNVLVPLPSERTPTATDPAVRAIVQRFLNAYPNTAPNRTDFDPRALNTNAPERRDNIDANLRLDREIRSMSQLTLYQSVNRQYIEAFQLVAGDNPDTIVHSTRSPSRTVLRRVTPPNTPSPPVSRVPVPISSRSPMR
jgi:hypothetical protein